MVQYIRMSRAGNCYENAVTESFVASSEKIHFSINNATNGCDLHVT